MALKEQLPGIELMPDIGQRARRHKKAKGVLNGREGGALEIDWNTYAGMYRELSSIKSWINGVVNELPVTDVPIVLLDFGGGAGFDWVRMAAGNKYRDMVTAGKMVFVVSNLNSDPARMDLSEIIERCSKSWYKPNPADWSWYIKNRHLVNFVHGDINALRRLSVSCNGNRIPLFGNVALFHENLALAHCYMPELELPMCGAFLRNRGVFMLGSNEIEFFKRRFFHEEGQLIEIAWNEGLRNIIRTGFNLRRINESYRIYRKSQ